MKKTKKVVALVTATILSLSSFVSVFAEDKAPEFVVVHKGESNVVDVKEDAEDVDFEEVFKKEEHVPQFTEEEEVLEKKYSDLSITKRSVNSSQNWDLGNYPVIKGFDVVNKKIFNLVTTALEVFMFNKSDDSYLETVTNIDGSTFFGVEYDVAEHERYAKVSITLSTQENYTDPTGKISTTSYFLDKETNAEISEDAFLEAIKEVEEPEIEVENGNGEATEDKFFLVPLRAIAERLGYEVSWDVETESVVITKDDISVSFKNGVNEYKVGDEVIKLESAPVLADSVLSVPNTLFTKILKVNLTVNDNGDYVIVEPKEA